MENQKRHQMVTDRVDFDIDDYIKKFVEPEDFNLREKLEQWKENGIVVFEDAVDSALINYSLKTFHFWRSIVRALSWKLKFE